MNMVEWLKNALGLCLGSSELTQNQQIEVANELKEVYKCYPEEICKEIRKLMVEQLEIEDYIYVLSYLIQYMDIEDFEEDLMTAILKQDYNWYLTSMMELQVIAKVKKQYLKKRLLHEKSIAEYSKVLNSNYKYLPIKQRNKKRIVIATEQILSALHAPTKVVLDFSYILQKELGYEVMLFACPSDGGLPKETWYSATRMNSIEAFRNMPIEMEYRGEVFSGYQINMTSESLKNYHMMLRLIYEWKPFFVFSMGMVNSVIELAGKFTTLVAMGMSIECPVSEGDILIRLSRKTEEEENEYLKVLNPNQKQIFMKQNIPVTIEKKEKICSREELGLPEDKFLIALVGNRLDSEIEVDFVDVMKRMLEENGEIAFVIIGEINQAREKFVEDIFKGKIYYLGYCANLIGTYNALNLYLNPKRLGGGFSAAMAISTGIPVVTLPNCDVAYNVGSEFVVNDFEEMIDVVGRYASDSFYYEEKRMCALNKKDKNTNEKMKEYVQDMLGEISKVMEDKNDSI